MGPEDLRYFNPFADVEKWGNKLPHWQQPGTTVFVTFRLADSLPSHLRIQWQMEREAWLLLHPKPWSPEIEAQYHQTFSRRVDEWLDQGHGECHLRDDECRKPVIETLNHNHGQAYWLHAWVIMPNHVHVLFSLLGDSGLDGETGAWKSVSTRGINKLLHRKGQLWQTGYFDRLVRDADHFVNVIKYIRRNPHIAGLKNGEYGLFESELVLAMAPYRR